MGAYRGLKNSFTGGEISIEASTRVNLDKYGSFCKTLENCLPQLSGSSKNRTGFKYNADVTSTVTEGIVRLIPFIFNTEPEDTNILIFTNLNVAVYSNLGVFIVNITTPYTATDILGIDHEQSGDIIYLTSENHPPSKIYRTTATSWFYEIVQFRPSVEPPATLTDTAHPTGTTELTYAVASVDPVTAEESYTIEHTIELTKDVSDWTGTDKVTLSWPSSTEVNTYNIYRYEAGTFGLIGVVETEPTVITCQYTVGTYYWQVTKFEYDVTKCPGEEGPTTYNLEVKWAGTTIANIDSASPIPNDPIVLSGYQYTIGEFNNRTLPGCNTIDQYQICRQAIGGTGTTTFDDTNFAADTSLTPTVENLPFENGNYPKTVTLHQQRLCFGGTALNPQTVYMSRTADYENFNKHKPIQDDDTIEFIVASRSIDRVVWLSSLRDLIIGTAGAEYQCTGAGGSGTAITPSSISVVVKSTWGSRQQLSPIEIGNSIIHFSRQGERLNDLFFDDNTNAFAGSNMSILVPSFFEGFKILSWTYRQAPDSTMWAVRDDGTIIVLTYLKEYQLFAWSRHITDGEFISITNIPNGESQDKIFAIVKRTIAATDKYYLEELADDWKRSDGIEKARFVDSFVEYLFVNDTSVLTGLNHLEGKTVSALADGKYSGTYTVVGGSITIKHASKNIAVGLPYNSTTAPLPFEGTLKSGTTVGQPKSFGEISLRFKDTGGCSVSADGKQFDDLRLVIDVWGQPPPLYTGDYECIAPGAGTESVIDKTIHVRQSLPLPMHLLAISVRTVTE